MKLKYLSLLGLVISNLSYASWTPEEGTIPTSVYGGYTDGAVFVHLDDEKSGCSNSLIKFTSESSDPKAVYAMALLANATGKRMRCNIKDNICSGNYRVGGQCYIK